MFFSSIFSMFIGFGWMGGLWFVCVSFFFFFWGGGKSMRGRMKKVGIICGVMG